jgi:hypothetical protein
MFAAVLMLAGLGTCELWGQGTVVKPSILDIEQTRTTSEGSQNGFPTFLAMYHVLDGAKSSVDMVALNGTLSLKNYDPTFGEVLWVLVYWQGECPAHDITLSQAAGILWSDIIKNPSQSDSSFPVNLIFPRPLPTTGCIGLYFGGGPVQYCPTYSFVTAFTSVWIGNQSDCSNEAAFLVNNWQAVIEGNFIQGAANHGICISPKVGDVQVIGNTMNFNNQNASPDNAIVQGVMDGEQVSCKGAAVQTATWANSLNYDSSNIVVNNWPASNESLWGDVFKTSVNNSTAIGIGTTTPQATLDINGYARLSVNSSEPASCQASNKGAIALNNESHICICDGSSWKFDSNGKACTW